ncbi:MAG: aldo/keto reductase [Crocinitomicaceae bacterium]|nr:aldo/keto reductase [Crocinitomicaceae bacterium]
MQKVLISDAGLEVSQAAYSFSRWVNSDEISLDKVKEMVAYVHELGINTFDLSALLINEKLCDFFVEAIEALKIDRDDLVYIVKVSNQRIASDGSIVFSALTEKSIQTQLQEILNSFKTSQIDLLLLENYDPLMRVDHVISALIKAKNQGEIGHFGVANFSVHQYKLFASRVEEEIITNHLSFNLLDNGALQDGRIDLIKQQYSKPLVFGPLANGRILNGMDPKAIRLRSVLVDLKDKYNSNVEQLAVAWLYKLDVLPIIGALNKERIKNAVSASEINLSYEDWHKIYQAVN